MNKYTVLNIIDFIDENNITEFADLFDYADDEHFKDLFPSIFIDSVCYMIIEYINSKRRSSIRGDNDEE